MIGFTLFHSPTFSLFLISEHYANGNITIFHLERGILKKDKNEISQDGRFWPANHLKVTHLSVENEDGTLSVEDDLLLRGSL